ncbi:hypothetical protein [Chitinimonas sp.]|uniref:hypothetical protein n=1 Tax=Chitinimonas sp. TaxID=1934313 RepID=UPI0035B3A387
MMMVWLRYAWARAGAAGRLGIWLLLGAVLLWAIKLRNAEAELAGVQAKLAQASQTQQQSGARPRRVADFYKHFPKLATLPDQLAALDAAAESSDLAINESHYQLQPVSGLALQRYQVDLPLEGDYPSLRRFLNKVLSEAPNAVLDEVRFERDEQSDVVTARLRLSYHYQSELPGAKP